MKTYPELNLSKEAQIIHTLFKESALNFQVEAEVQEIINNSEGLIEEIDTEYETLHLARCEWDLNRPAHELIYLQEIDRRRVEGIKEAIRKVKALSEEKDEFTRAVMWGQIDEGDVFIKPIRVVIGSTTYEFNYYRNIVEKMCITVEVTNTYSLGKVEVALNDLTVEDFVEKLREEFPPVFLEEEFSHNVSDTSTTVGMFNEGDTPKYFHSLRISGIKEMYREIDKEEYLIMKDYITKVNSL